jgi:hypothetical protein
MFPRKLFAAALLLTGMYGCTEHPTPTAPPGTGAYAPSTAALMTIQGERMERLARNFARALGNPGFRSRIRSSLEQSRFREGKLHFQGLLAENNRQVLREIAQETGEGEDQIQDDAANAIALEVYLPVATHRAQWQGGESILVATAIADEDPPVAYDPQGNRYVLDPATPPSTPVLAIVPVETDFSRPGNPQGAQCTIETCPPGGGGGGGGDSGAGGTPLAPGLYMSYAHVIDAFEGWLKGSPEYEVHVLGQLGQTDSLIDYQCAGEHAGGPYSYDQNEVDWTGNVLLFSQNQLNSYTSQHPGQSVRVFIVEDDDTACQIKSDNSIAQIFADVDGAYRSLTGGKDSTSGILKFFKKANALQKIWRTMTNLVLTNDDLPGNAVEDASVIQYGANWIIKGKNNMTTGWIKLDMR